MFITGAPTLGADGKDYRANFVHAPFSEQISTLSAFTLEARGFPACGESPVLPPKRYFMTATNNPKLPPARPTPPIAT